MILVVIVVFWAGKMTQPLKVLAHKPCDVRSIARAHTHMVKGQDVLHTQKIAYVYTHPPTSIN